MPDKDTSRSDVELAWQGTRPVPQIPHNDSVARYFLVSVLYCIIIGLILRGGAADRQVIPILLVTIFGCTAMFAVFSSEKRFQAKVKENAAKWQEEQESSCRGYKFIGDNYAGWLSEGQKQIVEIARRAAGLGANDPLVIEPYLLPASSRSKAPTVPTGDSGKAVPAYPHPPLVHVSVYILSDTKLIVVPSSEAPIIGSGLTGVAAALFSTLDALVMHKTACAVDIKEASLAAVSSSGDAVAVKVPESIQCFEIALADLNPVEVTKSPDGTEVLALKLNTSDGRRLWIDSLPRLSTALHKRLTEIGAVRAPREPEEEPMPKPEISLDGKACPMCAEIVRSEAKICRFCRYNFETGTLLP